MEKDQKSPEEVRKRMEAMRKHPCIFPHCGAKQFLISTLKLYMIKEKGAKPEPVKDSGVGAPLCKYHFALAQHCAVVRDFDGQDKFHGPLDEISLIEAVFGGMIFSGKMQDLMGAKVAGELKAKEVMAKNENQRKDAEPEADKLPDPDSDKQRSEVQQGQSGESKPSDN